MAEAPKFDPSHLINKLRVKSTKVRVEDVFAKMIEKMGGLDGFCKEYVEQYGKAPDGGITKARYLTGIVQLGQLVSKRDASTPIEDTSDEDIDLEITEIVTELGQVIPIVDMEKSKPDGPPPEQSP